MHRIFLGPESSFWNQNRFLGTDESNFWDQNRFLAPAMILSSGYDLRPDIELLSRSKALFMYHFKTHLRYFKGHQKMLCFESSFSAEVIWFSIYETARHEPVCFVKPVSLVSNRLLPRKNKEPRIFVKNSLITVCPETRYKTVYPRLTKLNLGR